MTFLKRCYSTDPRTWISIFTLFLPVTDSHIQDMLGTAYASSVILFNYHSLKVLHPLGLKCTSLKWTVKMDITSCTDITSCVGVLLCSKRKQELVAPIPAAETASWGEHMWFRLYVSPASETSAGFEECKGLLHRGWAQQSARCPGAMLQSSPLVLYVAQLGLSTGYLLVFLTLLGTSFQTPACCQRGKNVENCTKGEVQFLPCPAIPRRVRADWPQGGSTLPCHSAAHYCFSVLQYTD